MTTPHERPPAAIARLVHLFHVRSVDAGRHPFEIASDAAVRHAEALGAERAGEAVTWVLQRHEPGRDHRVAERAADTAARLRLAPAAPALVGCLERLSEYDPVAHAALRALEALGAPAVAPLEAAFARCRTLEDRVRLGTALAQVPVGDGRVRALLEGLLAEDPERAAGRLAAHGDPRALPALAATLDGLALPPAPPRPADAEAAAAPPVDAGELDRLEAIVAVAHAMLALKGKMTPAQREKFERAYARSDDLYASGYERGSVEPFGG